MGHYASEMGYSSGPRHYDQIIESIADEHLRSVASALYFGYPRGPFAEKSNSELAARTAQAIDNLIRQRIAEVLQS